MNVASTCWGMINGVSVALAVQQFKRRTVYLVRQSSSFFEFEIDFETIQTSTISMLVIFATWTIANEQYSLTHNPLAAHIVIALV